MEDVIKYLEERFGRLEIKVDTLAGEVSETKESVAYLRGHLDSKSKSSGNGNAVKYLSEIIRLLVVALLAAVGVKLMGK